MPKRILMQENGLTDQFAPGGYRIIGFEDGRFSHAGTSSKVQIEDNIPKVFVLARNKAIYEGGWPGAPDAFDSFTGKDRPRFLYGNQTGNLNSDYDLSKGNYSQIIFNGASCKSFKLPNTKFGENLAQLWLFGTTNDTNSVEIDFTKYPNLGYCYIGGQLQSKFFGPLDDYDLDWRPQFLITSSEINLPYCGAIWMGLTDNSLYTNFSSGIQKIYIYSDTIISISSVDLNEVTLDFSGFTWSSAGNFYSEGDDKYPFFNHELSISACINLTDLSIQNLPNLQNNPDSAIHLSFFANNLNQTSVDSILQSVDEAYGITFSPNQASLQLGKSSYGGEPTINPGDSLISGLKYLIINLETGDDFSNLGYYPSGSVMGITFSGVGNSFPMMGYQNVSATFKQNSTSGSGSGLEFTVNFDSSGYIESYTIDKAGRDYVVDDDVTTDDPYAGTLNLKVVELHTETIGEFTSTMTDNPAEWSNGTVVYYGSSFGSGKGFTVSSIYGEIEDGTYLLSDLMGKGSQTKAEFKSNTISRWEHLGGGGGLAYVGYTFSHSLSELVKYDQLNRVVWQGSATGSIVFEITQIVNNSAPTGGLSNSNYLSLLDKGWDVQISMS